MRKQVLSLIFLPYQNFIREFNNIIIDIFLNSWSIYLFIFVYYYLYGIKPTLLYTSRYWDSHHITFDYGEDLWFLCDLHGGGSGEIKNE